MPSSRIVVIGGVAAGPAAAAHAQRIDPEADVILFEQGAHISVGACEMPYYVADWIEDAETLLVLTPDEFEETRGAEVRTHCKVLAIHPERGLLDVQNVQTGEVREEPFDKLILAIGAHARMPDLGGLDAENMFPMRRLDDAIALKEYLGAHDVRHAVILGGGYIGVEMAEALRERDVRVTVLDPLGGLLPGYLDDDLRPLVHDVAEKHGVQVRTEVATGFEHDDSGLVRAVRTDAGELIGCQLVLVAMGVVPNTDLAERAGIRVGETGALAVDEHMQTNLPNVWACGDCVEVERVIDGAKVHLPLSPVAFRTARVAAANAAGNDSEELDRFPGVCMASAVKFFELEVAVVGMRLDEAREASFDAIAHSIESTTRVSIYPGARPIHVRYVVERGSGRLLGAEVVAEEGAVHRADVLVPLIREGWSVKDVRDLDLIYTPPFAPMMDPLLVAAHEAWRQARYTGV